MEMASRTGAFSSQRTGASDSSRRSRSASPQTAVPDPLRGIRLLLLGALACGPFAFGAVHPYAFLPLLLIFMWAGFAAWRATRIQRAYGVLLPPLPAWRWLAALHVLVLCQLIPLPPWLLRLVSPGSYAFHNDIAFVPISTWHAISVSPADTLRGLAFLIGMSCLYTAVYRGLSEEPWRSRLMVVIACVGCTITIEALLQAASRAPKKIYGLVQPPWDWAVFGPYVNRNHFAGFVALAIPVTAGLALAAWQGARARMKGRRHPLVVLLGEREGAALARWIAVGMVLVVGLIASTSRGGFLAFVVSSLGILLFAGRRWATLIVFALVTAAALMFVDLNVILSSIESRGVQGSRIVLWKDVLKIVPQHPLFGVGLNAFSTAYPRYQTIFRSEWLGEAHNDYLQALTDVGLVGAALIFGLLAKMLVAAWREARRDPLMIGALGALLAGCAHALVDFNWQIPANAATFVALGALAMRGAETRPPAILSPQKPA
ncbi:MAG: O-antigen ligase family protein [Vicinamibacteria bacterium]|jgi:O-antigen ligase|nr:O-antigen ligase family protein [Vicinamibacteria bacterium]